MIIKKIKDAQDYYKEDTKENGQERDRSQDDQQSPRNLKSANSSRVDKDEEEVSLVSHNEQNDSINTCLILIT